MSTQSNGISCAQCGQPITGEPLSGAPAQRKPCPQCGSTARIFSVHVHATITLSGSVQAEIITYPQTLLSAARSLIDDGQFSIAIVIAHMACEIASERVLSDAFAHKGIQYLEESLNDLLNGYSLANERLRTLYTALTGDEVQKQSFWQKFRESATCRNQIVHRGTIVGKAEAEESFKATSDLVAHLRKQLAR